ncbi:MAG: hypothetical protein PHE16_03000 [Aliarcobacter sp.]|nr:hypothetical protein [Aliarcobacter sp.]
MEKSYKLINSGSDIQIAYPLNMSDDLIAALEAARKNRSFVTITSGNMETGESWGDLYDSKGRIGLSRGNQYLFPLLVSFKRDDYDEDLEEEIDKSYDFLSELPTQDIAKYLNKHHLDVDEVLDCGGSIIGSIVAVQTGLARTKVAYKHPTFKGKDFSKENIKIDTETFTTECKTTSDKNDEVKIRKKTEKKFVLFIGGKVYSRHDSSEDLYSFLKANKQINLLN